LLDYWIVRFAARLPAAVLDYWIFGLLDWWIGGLVGTN
jgi:hypothetical protein